MESNTRRTTKQVLRVVVASPQDVSNVRRSVTSVAAELNSGAAGSLGVLLEVFRWEIDATPGLDAEGAQGRIDRDMRLEDADAVVCIFWRRLGQPVGDEPSGTVHEVERAVANWRRSGRPDVLMYFCTAPVTHSKSADAEEHARLLRYKESGLPKELLYAEYRRPVDFERRLHDDLTAFIRRRLATQAGGGRFPSPLLTPRPAVPAGAAGRLALTAAELRVIKYLPEYMSFAEIADQLLVSRQTVKQLVLSIYEKLDVPSRSEAVQRAIDEGLIGPAGMRNRPSEGPGGI